jgi:small subunit ribosomal protein S17
VKISNNKCRKLTGVVSSSAPDKTITIVIHTKKTHPVYKKQYSVTTKFMAHDEQNQCKVGDTVIISETKPISARKRFRLSEIVERAKLTEKDKLVIEGEEEQPNPERPQPDEKLAKKIPARKAQG